MNDCSYMENKGLVCRALLLMMCGEVISMAATLATFPLIALHLALRIWARTMNHRSTICVCNNSMLLCQDANWSCQTFPLINGLICQHYHSQERISIPKLWDSDASGWQCAMKLQFAIKLFQWLLLSRFSTFYKRLFVIFHKRHSI